MKKGQSILGDIFVALFFLIIIIGLIWIFFEHMPAQISNIKEQKACAEAETMSKFLFEVNETDVITEPFVINYSRFHSKKYNETLNETGAKASFIIKYSIYAFNNANDTLSIIKPNETYPNVYILRDGKDIIIRGGSNTTNVSFYLKLLFPLVSIDEVTETARAAYNIISNYSSSTSTSNTSEINVNADVIGGDPSNYEEINISLKEEPEVIYVREATCIGSCPIYIGHNESYLVGEIGPGSIYRQQDYCIIKRRGTIIRDNDTYSADLEVISW